MATKKKAQKKPSKARSANRTAPAKKKVAAPKRASPGKRPTDDQVAEFADRAEQEAMEAALTEPTAKLWGLLDYSDAPEPLGGGQGGFGWFASEARLVKFIVDRLPYYRPGPRGFDARDAAATVRKVMADVAAGRVTAGAGLKRLNTALRGSSVISWYGSCSELLEGTTKFARDARTWYRGEDVKGAAAAAPIKASERSEFLEMLREYAI